MTLQKINRRNFIRLAGVTSAGLFLHACTNEAVSTTTTAAVGTSTTSAGAATTTSAAATGASPTALLRMAVVGTPAHFDTATHAGTAGYVIRRAYNFLVRVGDDLNPYPDLATSWETPDNGQTWVFQLKNGAVFHHGTPFTADDAIFTLERVLDPDVGSAGAAILAGVTDITKNGDYELAVSLAAPDADFPVKLGTYQFPIIAHDFDPARMATEVSGTGPYRMVDFVPGERVVMERFEDYWEEGLPRTDEVEILTIDEETTRVNALLSRQVDLVPGLPTEFVGQIEAADGVEVGSSLAGSMHVVYMRSDRPPFDNPRLRQAVKLTLDRQALLQSVRQGVGEVSNDNPLAAGNPWFAETGMKEHNIDEAARLLSEAGYPDGLEKDLYVPGGQPGLLELAVAVQEMARPAGFQFNIVVIPSDVFWNDNWLHEDLGVDIWALRGTADEQFRIAYHCDAVWNESHYCNPEMDSLLDQAAATVDPEERRALYAQVQQTFVEEGGSAIPYHIPNLAAYTSDLKDYVVHPMGFWDDSRLAWLDR